VRTISATTGDAERAWHRRCQVSVRWEPNGKRFLMPCIGGTAQTMHLRDKVCCGTADDVLADMGACVVGL